MSREIRSSRGRDGRHAGVWVSARSQVDVVREGWGPVGEGIVELSIELVRVGRVIARRRSGRLFSIQLHPVGRAGIARDEGGQ